jgi:hypothetical protein
MEENVQAQEAQQEQVVVETTQIVNPFSDASWTEKPPQVVTTETQPEVQQQQQQVEVNPEANAKPEEKQEPNFNEFVKQTFGFEDVESVKSVLDEYKKLQETPKTENEIKFANEESKKLFEYLKEGKQEEAISLLNEQKRIEKLLTSDVTADTASDIVKLAMQKKYPELTQDEVDFQFKKKFLIPKEPVQGEMELTEDFELRKQEWQELVNEKTRELVIEAKLSKPEIEKYKTELALPDLPNAKPQEEKGQPNAEELQKVRQQYLDALKPEAIFDGFNFNYESEDAKFDVSFGVSPEEKAQVKTQLENLDVDQFFASRWFDETGTPKVSQISADIYLLENRDKVLQKFVNDSASKALAQYIQKTSNIQVNAGQQKAQFQPSGNAQVDMANFFFTQ